jgi:hypothetical protein
MFQHVSPLHPVTLKQDSVGGIPKMSSGSLIDYSWSLVALDLVREFENDFSEALKETFSRTACHPSSRVGLKILESLKTNNYSSAWFKFRTSSHPMLLLLLNVEYSAISMLIPILRDKPMRVPRMLEIWR